MMQSRRQTPFGVSMNVAIAKSLCTHCEPFVPCEWQDKTGWQDALFLVVAGVDARKLLNPPGFSGSEIQHQHASRRKAVGTSWR